MSQDPSHPASNSLGISLLDGEGGKVRGAALSWSQRVTYTLDSGKGRDWGHEVIGPQPPHSQPKQQLEYISADRGGEGGM